MSEKQEREFLPEGEAVDEYGISRQTFWRMRQEGLPFYRANTKILYKREELEGFMRRCAKAEHIAAAA